MKMNNVQIESFWSKVLITKKNDCWHWGGAKKPSGYGNVRINNKYLSSHRVAFSIVNGGIPYGYIVCHICDNPSCCNPNHLMLGTTKSNAADMLIKNRGKSSLNAARGENNGNSKLSMSDVKKIRDIYSSGEKKQYEIAEIFGVSPPAIGSIIRNKTWRDL